MALVSIDQLTPYNGYARTHPRMQIEQIFESIRKFGFNNPVRSPGICLHTSPTIFSTSCGSVPPLVSHSTTQRAPSSYAALAQANVSGDVLEKSAPLPLVFRHR